MFACVNSRLRLRDQLCVQRCRRIQWDVCFAEQDDLLVERVCESCSEEVPRCDHQLVRVPLYVDPLRDLPPVEDAFLWVHCTRRLCRVARFHGVKKVNNRDAIRRQLN